MDAVKCFSMRDSDFVFLGKYCRLLECTEQWTSSICAWKELPRMPNLGPPISPRKWCLRFLIQICPHHSLYNPHGKTECGDIITFLALQDPKITILALCNAMVTVKVKVTHVTDRGGPQSC
jgi:hypothetical protein